MTAFYSWRLIFMTFYGETHADHKTYEHAHESPPTMLVPLAVLALGATIAGLVFSRLLHRPRRKRILGCFAVSRRAQPRSARDA